MAASAGLYIHVPFCLGKCPYCDFYSVPFDPARADAYTEGLVRALEVAPVRGAAFDTVYFGGGTPSLLGERRLSALLGAVRRACAPEPGAEITLEANPGDLGAEGLRALMQMGFTRLSLGAQSFLPDELRLLGRRHSREQTLAAVRHAAEAGFAHLSLDLIIGLPGQSREAMLESVQAAAGLPIDHLSVYLLKREENTPFFVRYRDGDDEALARLYLSAVRALGEAGFMQYEISNFARPGGQSRHNLKYWQLAPYLGLGPAAHSLWGGRRLSFARDLGAFASAPDPFALWRDEGPGGGADEWVMLGLRLSEGIDLGEAANRGLSRPELTQKARRLAENGYATFAEGRLALTPEGFLVSNRVIGYLLGG